MLLRYGEAPPIRGEHAVGSALYAASEGANTPHKRKRAGHMARPSLFNRLVDQKLNATPRATAVAVPMRSAPSETVAPPPRP